MWLCVKLMPDTHAQTHTSPSAGSLVQAGLYLDTQHFVRFFTVRHDVMLTAIGYALAPEQIHILDVKCHIL